MQSGRWIAIPLLVAAVLLVSAGSVPRQIVGLDVASFADRDVLVLRTSGGVPVPSVYTRDVSGAAIEFLLRGVGADGLSTGAVATKLIAGVDLDPGSPDGVEVRVNLFAPELVDPQCLRFSQPSDHVILLEVFPAPGVKDEASLILDVESQLGLGEQPLPDSAASPEPAADGPMQSSSPDLAGIPTVDLRDADPARVLGLAADTGLLDVKGSVQVATENWGELSVKPAGQSLASWTQETPPSELYLSGTADQLADFLRLAESSQLASQPTLAEFWAANRPPYRTRTSLAGVGSASSGMREDPYAGLYYADSVPGAGPLSDVRVTLPAMDGMNLYDVLHYLSLISGISLIIDPYAFDEPFGSRRAPLPPEQAETDEGGPGYRPASVFDPQLGRSGTVMGNFDNVPFDTALKLILDMHELEFVVYGGGGSGAMRYGKPAASREPGDPQGGFDKPVILVTSRERLEQELTGANQIDLYQFHYADPYIVTDILASFDLLPGTNSGWYIYGGTGMGRFGGGGGGSAGGSGAGGGGGSGGGVSGSGSGRGGTAGVPDVVTYRGSSRQPVLDAVQAALGAGRDVIRVLLAPERNGFLVTTFGS